jgi:hypothetical protein
MRVMTADTAPRDLATPAAAPPTVAEVMAVLGTVIDPELGADIVSLGMVPAVEVADDGVVTVGVKLTIRGLPAARRDQAGGREQGLGASRRGRRQDQLGRDGRRRAHRGDDQGPLERPPERARHRDPAALQGAGDRQRQGRRGQELGHGQPGRSAGRCRPHRRRARRRHLGLLGAAPARHLRPDGGPQGRGFRQAQDRPQRARVGEWRAQGGVDRDSSSTRTPR